MRNRISHMNPPMPDSVCKEEMQNATIDNDVIVEYITDTQGRKVKKLKPLQIKSEPDLTESIPNMSIVMTIYQIYQKTISYRKEK